MSEKTRVVGRGIAIVVGVLLFGTALAQPIADIARDRDESAIDRTNRPVDFLSIYFDTTGAIGLERIDTRTGQGTHLWFFDIPDDPEFPGVPLFVSPFGIAFDVDGTIYTIINWMDFNPEHPWSRLARVDRFTGAVTFIGEPYPMHFNGPEMDDCGNIYATGFRVPPVVFGDSNLYRIDKVTGVATQVGDTGQSDWMDLDFDSEGNLWTTTDNKLYTLNTDTGAATFDTEIIGVPHENIPGVCEEDWPFMEVMTIAFDKKDNLWATAMRGLSQCAEVTSPVMEIDTETGLAKVIGYTGLSYNHGGDIAPRTVTACHLGDDGGYTSIAIGLDALPAHLAHGDVLPSGDGPVCGCPSLGPTDHRRSQTATPPISEPRVAGRPAVRTIEIRD